VKGFARLLFLEERDFQRDLAQMGQKDWHESSRYFMKPEESLKGLKDNPSVPKSKIISYLIDYNNGVLLAFTRYTYASTIFDNLKYRTQKCLGIDPEDSENEEGQDSSTKNLYFIFGYGLDSILDAEQYDMIQGQDVFLHVPRHIEFIGSLAEYVESLPTVEDDWYAEATLKPV
jgi:hypothetical protein